MNSSSYFSSKSKPIQTPKLDIATAQIATSTTNGLAIGKGKINGKPKFFSACYCSPHFTLKKQK